MTYIVKNYSEVTRYKLNRHIDMASTKLKLKEMINNKYLDMMLVRNNLYR